MSKEATITDRTGLVERWQGLGLTQKQVDFLLDYLLNGRNATRAAIAAGYSPKNAASQGSHLLKNPKIQRALALTAAADALTVEALVARLAEYALDADLADFQPYLAGECTLKDLRDRGVNTKLIKTARTRTVERTSKDGVQTVTATCEVVLHDPLAAIALLRDLVQPAAKDVEDDEEVGGLVELVYQRFGQALQRPSIPGVRPPRLPPRPPGDGPAPLSGPNGSGGQSPSCRRPRAPAQ